MQALESRKATGKNQTEFWSALGSTQACGSRYENGRRIPKAIRMLMKLQDGSATVEQLRSGELARMV